MLLIIFLGIIVKLTSVAGDCDFGNMTQNNFDWNKVGINIDMITETSSFKIYCLC